MQNSPVNKVAFQPFSNFVLLPGLMCDQTFWAPLALGLSAAESGLACQVVDYGDADTLTAMAEAVLAVAPPRFTLAGHSMGGRVALEVVRLASTRVQSLMLMDTGYLPLAQGQAGEVEKAGRLALIKLAEQEGVRAMAAQWVLGMVHPDRLSDNELIEAILAMFARKSAQRFARQQNALLTRADLSPVLAGLKVPTLLLTGRQDAWATVAQHAAMQDLAPHAVLKVIEDAGHMVLMEQPEACVREIKAFLKEVQESSCSN